MTPELLAGAAGILLSLAFSYVPKLNGWYAGKYKESQQLIMLGLLVLVALLVIGLACGGLLADLTGIVLTCDKAGAIVLVRALVLAIIANQGIFQITPAPKSVRLAKALRGKQYDSIK